MTRGETQITLSQTQKVRLQRALELIESLSSKPNANSSVTVADPILVNSEEAILKGHGTSMLNGDLVATVCGVVEQVNKLVYVRTLRARYKPDVGDIIVGRVVEVSAKRWRIEINYSQDAVLMLSSMNLPDGIQRRRTAVDELNMRSIFEENDVLCVSPSNPIIFGTETRVELAEVRGFQHDGLHLQARSQKYGKLQRGQLLTISPYLVKKAKQHFHHLEQFGIDLVLGCNGFIWIGEHVDTTEDMVVEQVGASDRTLEEREETYTPLKTRQNICRAANAVRVLSSLGFVVTVEVVTEIMNLCSSMNLDIHEMLGSEFYVLVAEKEAERRRSNKKKR